MQVGQYQGMSLLTYPYSGISELNCLPPPRQPTLFHTRRCAIAPSLAPPKYPSLRFRPNPLIRSDAKPRKHSPMTTLFPRRPASSFQADSYSSRKSMKLVPCSWTDECPSQKQRMGRLRHRQRPSLQPQRIVTNGLQYEGGYTLRLPRLFPIHRSAFRRTGMTPRQDWPARAQIPSTQRKYQQQSPNYRLPPLVILPSSSTLPQTLCLNEGPLAGSASSHRFRHCHLLQLQVLPSGHSPRVIPSPTHLKKAFMEALLPATPYHAFRHHTHHHFPFPRPRTIDLRQAGPLPHRHMEGCLLIPPCRQTRFPYPPHRSRMFM